VDTLENTIKDTKSPFRIEEGLFFPEVRIYTSLLCLSGFIGTISIVVKYMVTVIIINAYTTMTGWVLEKFRVNLGEYKKIYFCIKINFVYNSNMSLNQFSRLPELLSLKNPKIRALLISIAWRVFHHLYGKRHATWVNFLLSPRDMRLAVTAKNFLISSCIQVNKWDNVTIDIEKLKNAWKGFIIWTHATWIFIDYLPLFTQLGDDVLKKCIFYTGEYNLTMNQREFPDYQFRAVPEWRQTWLAKWFRERLKEDIQKVKENGWYIFLMPAGGGRDYGQDFKAIFSRLIAGLDDDFPALSFHAKIGDDGLWSYVWLLKQRLLLPEIQTISLQTRFNHVQDWKYVDGRRYYDALFWIQNPPSE
jgi:hypothetical protein